MKMLLKTNNRQWKLHCTFERYLQLHREKERERKKVNTAVTFRVVKLSWFITTPIR